MRLLILSSNYPSDEHTTGAASMVLYCLTQELCNAGVEVLLQIILPTGSEIPLAQERARAACVAIGMELLPTLYYDTPSIKQGDEAIASKVRRSLGLLLNPRKTIYPSTKLRVQIAQRVQEFQVDLLYVFWSPEGLAASYKLEQFGALQPKYAYYGMPDHAANEARVNDPAVFQRSRNVLVEWLKRFRVSVQKRIHLDLMRDCDVIANLSALHAEYYSTMGHPASRYVPNMWPEPPPSSETGPPATELKPRIIGSVGHLNSTGNTYGLLYIGNEIAPRLDAVLGEGNYEIHILGSGALLPQVATALQRSTSIIIRGWVEDINAEISAARVFLVANNTGAYQGAHTRFLHAWSLRACCVSYSFIACAMPEMKNGVNVLLGTTPDEITGLLLSALRDPDLRRRIGHEGWRTYQTHFKPAVVVKTMLEDLNMLANQSTT